MTRMAATPRAACTRGGALGRAAVLGNFAAACSAAAGVAVPPSACQPKAGDALLSEPCSAPQTEAQGFVLPPPGGAAGPVHMKVTYVEGLCLDSGRGDPKAGQSLTLEECDPSRAGEQHFKLEGAAGARKIVHGKTGLCLNLNSKGQVDLYGCSSLQGDSAFIPGCDTWSYDSKSGEVAASTGRLKGRCLAACPAFSPGPSPGPPLPPPPPPDAPVTLGDGRSPFKFAGVWAMSANGAARQLFEYPEPARSEICDMLFLPGKGTRWQGLKVEIGGDVESSYGSMGSYAHTSDKSSWSYERGDQWWLIEEAKKRDPDMPLMALSWGMPGWVGGGKTLSQGGADYHVEFLLGAKRVHNISFDWVGIWNEAPWTAEYILMLRKSLDAAGLQSVQITAADGGTDVISAAAQSPELAAAVGSFVKKCPQIKQGIHTHLMVPDQDINRWGGKKQYFNTENDLVDGAMPQWGETMAPSLNWPLAFINNYLLANATATMLCPAFHGWSMNLGRHNHGPAWFNDPWSGFYQLAAPFFTQAQFTQFTEIGWEFILGGAGNRGCAPGLKNGAGMPICNLTFASLASPDGLEFSMVVVSQSNHTETLQLGLEGELAKHRGQTLQRWETTQTQYFTKAGGGVVFPPAGNLALVLPPRSVTTISNRKATAGFKDYIVPQRTRFPMPYASDFGAQPLESPCRFANSIFGAFEVAAVPGSLAAVCRQAVPDNPGGNAWTHRKNGWPIATLPSGSNFANVQIETDGQIIPAKDGTGAVTICGRGPIWSPSACQTTNYSLGLCLTVLANTSGVSWRITEAHNQYSELGCHNFVTLASGPLSGSATEWRRLSLSFSGATVEASIGGINFGGVLTTSLSAGVAGYGSGWNVAHFSNLTVAAHPNHPPSKGSWLFDVLPSEAVLGNTTGLAGFILDLSGGRYPPTAPPIRVFALGRFLTAGNKRSHTLGIVNAATGRWLGENTTVAMAGCQADMLGFCYGKPFGAPLKLTAGNRYYVVSSEQAGEAMVKMTKSASGADYADYRDGDTFMSYALPGFYPRTVHGADAGRSLVAGRVVQLAGGGGWVEEAARGDLDTMYGPLNMLLAE